jgi:glycosyltransferase involved in cell wall biosynthesis
LRVLVLCYEFTPVGGGGAKVAENLIEQLLRRGDEVDLVTMGFDDLPLIQRRGNLTIHRVPCGRRKVASCDPHEMLFYILRALPLVLRLVRERQPDINHTHFIFPDGVLAAIVSRITGLPFIVTAHGSDVPGDNPDRFQLLHRVLKPLWKFVVRSAECIVCPSEYIKELLLESAPGTPCAVIPNGIDVDRYASHKPREKRILVVSRLVERKGVQYLLHALKGLQHDYEVCVVGDGDYLRTLKALAAELDVAVNFTGFVDNKSHRFRELLEVSEIFVFTSSAENFPIVLLEAMSAGLAIITADDTGCREVVGDTAIKVPSQNPEAIRTALVELMQDPERRAALGRAARGRAESKFTEEAVADQYHETYRRYANRDARKRARVTSERRI